MEEHDVRIIRQFDKWAAKYDRGIWGVYFSKSYDRSIKISGVKDSLTILDLGCGTSGLVWRIVQLFENIKAYCVDISPEMINSSRKKMAYYDNVMFIVASAHSIPLEDDIIDVVYCLNSFHHYRDAVVTVQEIRRILKPGGKLVILDPYRNNIIRRVWCVILKILFSEYGVKYYKKEEIVGIVEACGLRLEKQVSHMYFTIFTVAIKDSE